MRIITTVINLFKKQTLFVCVIADNNDAQLRNISEQDIINKYNSTNSSQKIIINDLCLVDEKSTLYAVNDIKQRAKDNKDIKQRVKDEEIYYSFCIPTQKKKSKSLFIF